MIHVLQKAKDKVEQIISEEIHSFQLEETKPNVFKCEYITEWFEMTTYYNHNSKILFSTDINDYREGFQGENDVFVCDNLDKVFNDTSQEALIEHFDSVVGLMDVGNDIAHQEFHRFN